ncbi:hypothetical protein HDV05_006919, partial [Chytridiales sp. JEL 0842]
MLSSNPMASLTGKTMVQQEPESFESDQAPAKAFDPSDLIKQFRFNSIDDFVAATHPNNPQVTLDTSNLTSSSSGTEINHHASSLAPPKMPNINTPILLTAHHTGLQEPAFVSSSADSGAPMIKIDADEDPTVSILDNFLSNPTAAFTVPSANDFKSNPTFNMFRDSNKREDDLFSDAGTPQINVAAASPSLYGRHLVPPSPFSGYATNNQQRFVEDDIPEFEEDAFLPQDLAGMDNYMIQVMTSPMIRAIHSPAVGASPAVTPMMNPETIDALFFSGLPQGTENLGLSASQMQEMPDEELQSVLMNFAAELPSGANDPLLLDNTSADPFAQLGFSDDSQQQQPPQLSFLNEQLELSKAAMSDLGDAMGGISTSFPSASSNDLVNTPMNLINTPIKFEFDNDVAPSAESHTLLSPNITVTHHNPSSPIPEPIHLEINKTTYFKCSFPGCDKMFTRMYNLKGHYRAHTGERPYECTLCPLKFCRHHDLKRHMKLHEGGKPHTCPACGKGFVRADALKRHLKSTDPLKTTACSQKMRVARIAAAAGL